MIRQNKTKQADISGEDVDTHDVAKLTNTILVSLPTHELAANKSPAHELVANKYYPAHELAGKKYENLVLELPAEPSAQEGEGKPGSEPPRSSTEGKDCSKWPATFFLWCQLHFQTLLSTVEWG